MSHPLSRDIPKGAAAAIVALALVAGVVTGREPPEPAPARQPAIEPAAAPVEEIDLKRVARLRSGREVNDVFAAPAAPPIAIQHVAVPVPAAPLPAAPVVPPLPFTYLGRMKSGDRVTVYLLRNEEMLVVQVGSTLDAAYRLASISDSSLEFVYLPLDARQRLPIPAAP